MGQQVNIRCEQYKLLPRQSDYEKMNKYLKLDPKTSDLTIIRIIKVRTDCRCIDIRRIIVS